MSPHRHKLLVWRLSEGMRAKAKENLDAMTVATTIEDVQPKKDETAGEGKSSEAPTTPKTMYSAGKKKSRR